MAETAERRYWRRGKGPSDRITIADDAEEIGLSFQMYTAGAFNFPAHGATTDLYVTAEGAGYTFASKPAIAESELVAEIRELTAEIRQLRATLKQPTEASLREVSDEQALNEVSAILQSKNPLYPSDLSEMLRLDYDQISRVLTELHRRGMAEPARPSDFPNE